MTGCFQGLPDGPWLGIVGRVGEVRVRVEDDRMRRGAHVVITLFGMLPAIA